MKTRELKLSEKELRLLTSGLFAKFSDEQLENNPNSLASKLLDKLYDAKESLKSDTKNI
jgi:hypothetical protein